MTSDAWQHAEPSLHHGGLTIFSGSTFAITNALGDMLTEPQGLFVADQRVLCRLRLLLDQHETVVLRAGPEGDDQAQVIRRATRHTGGSERALLVSTALRVQPGSLEVRLMFRNNDSTQRSLSWRLTLAADFANIFAVKEGRAPTHGEHLQPHLDDDRLEFIGPTMTTRVSSRDATVTVSTQGMSETLHLPPRDTVTRVVDIQALHNGHAAAHPLTSASRRLHRPQVATRSSELATAVDKGFADVEALRIHDSETGSDTLAAGAPWFMTLFGRDSLITALMVAPFDQNLGLQVLRSLAHRQGRVVDPVSEEEPGRILHEKRMSADVSLFEGHRTRYYGSTDATPLFVILAAELVRNGLAPEAVRELMPAVDGCLGWIEKYGDLDGDGFVESVRRSDAGLINQGWKDSWNAIVDGAGMVVDPPVSLVEVQAYVYAALRARAYLARVLGESSGATWDSRARHLREAIDAAFWLPELRTYALALDPENRPLASSASNAGHMLWTGAALPARVGPLAATLMSRRLRTHWGVRTLASDHPAFDPLGYHTGSVWPHDTALIAWGLSRWGFGRAAAEVSESLLRAATHFGGSLPELIAGLDASDPISGSSPVRFPTACSPQAWAAGSPMLLLRAVLGLELDRPNGTIQLHPHVPEAWLPLTLHQIRSGGERLLVRAASSGEAEMLGVPPDISVAQGPFFVD